MRKNVLIFGGIAAVVAFYLFTKANAGKKVAISFQSLKFGGDLLSPKIIISLLLQNPTNQSFNINSIVGSVFLNDKFVGEINTFKKVVLTGNATGVIDVNLKLGLLQSFTTVKNIIKNKGLKTVVARVQGNANVDGLVLPFNENISI